MNKIIYSKFNRIKKGRNIAYDCAFYLGSMPCIWNKRNGDVCVCSHYNKKSDQTLIIKLDAIGDVLRTTCIIPSINRKWPGTNITWITRSGSIPILQNNPYINEIIPYGSDAILELFNRKFNRIINLDAGRISAGMASIAKGNIKIGYLLEEGGYVTPTNPAAEDWLRMGIFDDLKKINQKTYQNIMCDILDVPADGMRYILELKLAEIDTAHEKLANLGVKFEKTIIGIHTGGGGRWKHKQWTEKGFVDLINELNLEYPSVFEIVLFGGSLERELNQRIVGNVKFRIIDTGCDNELREFASLVANCSIVLSGDTLAMHLALALGRRVVVLFGPTSSAEIELFGLGEKIMPELDCLCCYKTECDCSPNCMELISVEMVKNAILRQKELLKDD